MSIAEENKKENATKLNAKKARSNRGRSQLTDRNKLTSALHNLPEPACSTFFRFSQNEPDGRQEMLY
jgi:hypothetical protein